MNFNQALEQIAPKLALCGTKEEVIGLVRPLLVRAYRDGKRFMLHEAMLKKAELNSEVMKGLEQAGYTPDVLAGHAHIPEESKS